MQKVTMVRLCPDPSSLGLGAEEEGATRFFLSAADLMLPAELQQLLCNFFTSTKKLQGRNLLRKGI